MPKKQIKVECSGGEVKISTLGYKGVSCREATKALESALGGKAISDTPTPEMNERELRQNGSQNTLRQ